MKVELRSLTHGSAFHIFALVLDGSCETTEFFAKLEKDDKDGWTSLLALISRVAEHGPPRNKQKSRDVGGNIFELKAKGLRLCCFYEAGRIIVCTHGFHKLKRRSKTARSSERGI